MVRFYLLLLLATFSSFSFAGMSVPFQPTSVTQVVKNATGFSAGTNFSGKTASNDPKFGFRRVPIPNTSLAQQVARVGKFAFTPAGLAFAAASWYFSDALDQWMYNEGLIDDPNYVFNQYFYTVNGPAQVASTSGMYDSAVIYLEDNGYTDLSFRSLSWSGSFYVLEVNHASKGYSTRRSFSWYPSTCGTKTGSTSYCPLTAPQVDSDDVPVSTDQFIDYFDSLSPSEQNDVFTDPATNAIDQAIQELQDAAQDLTNDFDALNDSDPATTPTTDLTNGDTATDSVTDFPPVSKPQEMKEQCVEFPDSVGCMDMGSDLDPTELQQVDIGTNYAQHSLSSNNTCPSNLSHTTKTGFSLSFDLSPICDSLAVIKPVFIVICSLIGMMILSGAARND